ncbi:thioredoxin domain-containing protein [Streptomyces aidingensis]|uniref:Thioredoxin n=1 Tax=Streptomyces aidingensis TaxID=910347 RepID=A0A1I1LWT2_9ACTN|nr:thioredoxin domain-containing protein [Streptomyces aidingensis]SFC73930.1 Thioredoxin [Streptomyces aidingensis]
MSKRNSQEAKRAARERLRAEREKQAKREKVRRQLVVGGAIVGVLAVAGVVGVAVAAMGGGGDSTDWEAAAEAAGKAQENGDATYAIPANAEGEDGLRVVLGEDTAADSVILFEEPRCPHCAEFDHAVGEAFQEAITNGDIQAEYVFGAFFDDNPGGGTGSKNAISALGAALNVSDEAFLGYLKALYSEDFHTSTNSATDFESDERLVEIGKGVDALSDPADFKKFEDAVNSSTYAEWAVLMAGKFGELSPQYEVTGTPSLVVNGTKVETPMSAEAFRQALEASEPAAAEEQPAGDEAGDTAGSEENAESDE